MRTVYPIGTTLYQPDRCANGYTLLFGKSTRLIDMNGRVVNKWTMNASRKGNVHRARLLENGNVLVSRGDMHSVDGCVQEYSWEGDLVWEGLPEGKIPHEKLLGPHHDVWRKENGNTLMVCRDPLPPEYLAKIREPLHQGQQVCGDAIVEINREGEQVWIWHAHEHLDVNHYRLLASPGWHGGPFNSTVCDWTHVNTVQALPENKWFDAGDERFRPGNILISPRQLDTIYIIDYETSEVVWEYSGDYFGGLSGQHEPHMIEPDLPGGGNITIFDNGASPWADLGHAGKSYVLEINPQTKELVWVYDDRLSFHATYTSSAQRLWNGNTMILESSAQRVFEVAPDCEVVWEHIAPTPRCYRYPYDHCPQTAGLGTPREVSVTPPAEFRIEADGPLD